MRSIIATIALVVLAFGAGCQDGEDPPPCVGDACDPVACIEGDQKPADDGCNTCICDDSGAWACTEMACPTVDPCEGLACGDPCNTCVGGPGADPCIDLDEPSYCAHNGECLYEEPICEALPVDPCDGLACGAPCDACGPDADCDDVETFCDQSGECVASLPSCEDVPTDPCEGLVCGAVCDACGPDADCPDAETFCDQYGECVPTPSNCEEELVAECGGIECGTPCDPCAELTEEQCAVADFAPHICTLDGECQPQSLVVCEGLPLPACIDKDCGELCDPCAELTEEQCAAADFAPHACDPNGACVPEALAVCEEPLPGQCYSTGDCADGEICTVDTGACDMCADCPECDVCCGSCVPAPTDDVQEVTVCSDVMPSDPVDVTLFGLVPDQDAQVQLDVTYSGGCKDHLFSACFSVVEDNSADKAPPADMVLPHVSVEMALGHDAQGDTCEAALSETLVFSLADAIEQVKSETGYNFGLLEIDLVGTDKILTVEF